MNQILIQIILGAIQGITEWLPVSSSGILTVVNSKFLGITDLGVLLHTALFLHFGTFLAALIYLRKDVLQLFKTLFKYKYQDESSKKTLKFLIITTLISGAIGLAILGTLTSFESQLQFTGKTITAIVGVLLLFTGIMQIKSGKTNKSRITGLRKQREIKNSDSLILGFMQGLSSLPGLSRSGITISTLLLKKFDDTTALKLSFLMSLPIVFFGNLILNFQDFTKIASSASIYGLLASFIFGILTIHVLMRMSKRINFGWFVLIFALIMLGSLLFY